MNVPEVSVIICTYNRSELLYKTFETLKEQQFNNGAFPWELIVVDNNSNDRTKDVVMSWRDKDLSNIRYIFEPRQGKSFALNRGIEEAQSTVLVFTDDDVILDVHWLSSFYEASRKYQHNVIGGRTLPLLDTALPEWLTIEGPNSRAMNGPFVRHDRGGKVKEYDDFMTVPFGCNLLIRKEVFVKHGLFNTRLGVNRRQERIMGEDTEFLSRVKGNGEKLLYYPPALVYHPVPPERLEKQYFKRYYWGSGRERVLGGKTKSLGNGRTGVPRYLIKEAFTTLLRLLIALPEHDKPKKFYRELQLLYVLGAIYEHYFEQ